MIIIHISITGKWDILYINRMKLYRQHPRYIARLTRLEISAHLDTSNYAPVGRKYLNSNMLTNMAELEKLGADIGNIYINPDKEIVFRAYITKPIWYMGHGDDIAIWTNESDVEWIGR